MEIWELVSLSEGYDDSHILSIDIKDKEILLGTYGRGGIFSRNNGELWVPFDTSSGLSWNFVLGGAWDDDFIILALLGDGVNISTDGGVHWERYGYNFFGVEYLYAVDAVIDGGAKYIPTADGLVVFEDSIQAWRAITEKEGLASQYIYDITLRGDMIALGTLHGYSISNDKGNTWRNFSPNGKFVTENLPMCKVRAVEFSGRSLYAGCDDGLFVSHDAGASWNRLGRENLASEFIRDLAFDGKGKLWIATYKEAAMFDPEKQAWRTYGIKDGLPEGGVNCLGIMHGDDILAGTNTGLYRLTSARPLKPTLTETDAAFDQTEEPLHQWMLRPISPEYQNLKDQTYLYGSTMGGNFRQHQGNEYNNPEGVPILAVDDGDIVYTDTSIGHTVLKCNTKSDTTTIYAHYHHQHEILKMVGERVKRGEAIGTIGKKGNVTNEHLHFEVAVSPRDSAKDSVSTTRNSELWVEPLPGCGTIVGMLKDSQGNAVPGARIYGVTKPIPTETPFSFAETYKEKVHPDELYGENFVIGDVPAGEYILRADIEGRKSRVKVRVEPGRVTRVVMTLR